MRAQLDRTHGLIVSERLGAALTPLLGRAGAQRALERATADALSRGTGLAQALGRDPAVLEVCTAERLRDLTDPTRYPGSAPELTDRALTRQPLARHPRTPFQDPR